MSEQTRASRVGATVQPQPAVRAAPTAWVGWIWFAAILLITVGLFNVAFPILATIVIALDLLVIWAVVVHGEEIAPAPPSPSIERTCSRWPP